MVELSYGKKITYESYHGGKLRNTKVEYSIPVMVQDKSQIMTEILKCIELITNKETDEININIEADAKTHHIKLLTKKYVIDL